MDVMVERGDRVWVPMSVTLDCTSGRREVRLSDLSTGGCYIDSIAAVRAAEIVGLKLFLPNGEIEELFGTVVYVHEGIGFGIQFNDMSREQRTILEQLILLNGGKL
jgi:hypothetical protein